MSHRDEEARAGIDDNIVVASVSRGPGTMLEVMAGMREILGTARFNHVMQGIGRRRVQQEWERVAASESIEQGISDLFERLSASGWGRVEITHVAFDDREASFRIHRGWEGAYQRALGFAGESSYMVGALAECCARAFGAPCRAEQVRFAAMDGDYDEIEVTAGRDSIELFAVTANEAAADVIGALEQEIKERAITEAALRVSEGRLRSFLNSGVLGVSMTSPKVGWLDVNDRLCEILGYSREELFQKTWPELTHPDDLPADIASLKRLHAGEMDSLSQEKRFIRKDGGVVDANVNVQVMRRPDGSIEFLMALVQDVTDKKRAERELKQQEQMIERQEEAIRVLSSPVIQVWEGVFVLPIVGALDAERASLIMTQLLAKIAERRARHAILDLTGVEAIDPVTSQHLMQIVNTVRLLGSSVLVSGISPTVATTMVNSGVDLGGVTTSATLHEALKAAIADRKRRGLE